MHRVFAYGTLKRGFTNHRIIQSSTFVGEAYTAAQYRMLDGRFPVLRDAGPDCMQISGELFDIDAPTLAQLDELEGLSLGMYDRIEIDIVLLPAPNVTSRTCRAFVYIGCGKYWDDRAHRSCVNLDRHGHIEWMPQSK